MATQLTARVGCAVLAAGKSQRFRRANKLVAPLGGKPVAQWAIDAAVGSRSMQCAIVLGYRPFEVERCIDERRCSILVNAHWQEGIATSIRCAVQFLDANDACIFTLADQPFIDTTDLNRLIDCFVHERNAIVALRVGAVWGVPMLFPRADFPALLRLTGDHGAKRFAETQRSRVRFIQARSSNAFVDIDSPADLRSAEALVNL